MSNMTTTFVRRGKIYWAKILGDPVKDYDGTNREWTFDFVPENESELRSALKRVGAEDRLRTKEGHLDEQPYMTLKQKEKRPDGSVNRPLDVVDAAGKPWDSSKLIGNESIVDVKFDVIDFGPKKYKGVYPRAVRILEHVEYKAKAFDEIDENDEYYKAAVEATKTTVTVDSKGSSREDLEDDIPM